MNLRAQEELAEAQERIDTITTEKEDVAQAVAKLRRAITTLNNEAAPGSCARSRKWTPISLSCSPPCSRAARRR
ncbi:MAG: hypothetical protein R3C16_07560 [Hyphomonadaceae bacterium]